MNVEPKICYLKPLSEKEIISINKYWSLKDTSKDEFKYTLKQIDAQRDPDCKPVSNLTKKASCLLLNPSFFCKTCAQPSPVNNRTSFLKRQNLSSVQCSQCEEKKRSTLREESIEILRNFLDSALNKSDYFPKLTYIDKLILLTILTSDDYQEKKPVFTSDARRNITGSENVDFTALSQLINLGALVKIDALPEEVRLAETRAYEDPRRALYKKSHYRHSTQRNPFAIETGIYFSLPTGFSSSIEFIGKIYEDVSNGGITIEEAAQLKRLVIDIRIDNFTG